MAMERTIIILKPDAVTRQVCGEIIARFEKRGLKIAGLKMLKLTDETLNIHYAHHVTKPFFPRLSKFMKSAPVIAVVLEGNDSVNQVRKMCGATYPLEAAVGTIRGDYGMNLKRE